MTSAILPPVLENLKNLHGSNCRPLQKLKRIYHSSYCAFPVFHPRSERVRTRHSGSISHIFYSLKWMEGERRRRRRKRIHQTGSIPGLCMTLGGGNSGTLHADPSTNCQLAVAGIKLNTALTLFLLAHLSGSSWVSSCSYAEYPADSAPGLGWEH